MAHELFLFLWFLNVFQYALDTVRQITEKSLIQKMSSLKHSAQNSP